MASKEDPRALQICDIWFRAGPDRWFARDTALDEACRGLLADRTLAEEGALSHWGDTAAGSVALIVLFDQVPRNALRGTAAQFSTDGLALAAAEAAVHAGHDRAVPWPAKNILYLPFQHAEDLAAQQRGLDLYRRGGDKESSYWALLHADAIGRFGRFPHRNAMLGRETTPQEADYLATGGFAG